MNFNLIMENWRKFTKKINEQTEGSQFYKRDYDKNPLEGWEIKLLNADGDEGDNARAEMLAHITDTRELPDMDPGIMGKIGLMAKKDGGKNFNIFSAIMKKYGDGSRKKRPSSSQDQEKDSFSTAVRGSDGTQQSVPVKASQYHPASHVATGGMKIIILNELPDQGVSIRGPSHRMSADLRGAGSAGSRWSGEPDEDRSNAIESGKMVVGINNQNSSGYVLAPAQYGAYDSEAWRDIEVPDEDEDGIMAPSRSAYWHPWKMGKNLVWDVVYYDYTPGDEGGGTLVRDLRGENKIYMDPEREFQGIAITPERGAVLMDPEVAENLIKTGQFQ